MWKPGRARAERHFAGSQNKTDKTVKQKEKAERDRDDRMARLRDLRLAKEAEEAAQQGEAQKSATAEQTEAQSPEEFSARLPRVHPHQS